MTQPNTMIGVGGMIANQSTHSGWGMNGHVENPIRHADGLFAEALATAGRGEEANFIFPEVHDLLRWLDGKTPTSAVWGAYLNELREMRGDSAAFRAMERLGVVVSHLWGEEVLHALKVAMRKPPYPKRGARVRTKWDRAARSISYLPLECQAPFWDLFERSLAAEKSKGRRILPKNIVRSADTLHNMTRALSCWLDWQTDGHHFAPGCHDNFRPTGNGCEAWAKLMIAQGKSMGTAQARLEALLSSWRLVKPEHDLEAAEWVAHDWSARARRTPPATKTAAGTVPATTIFDLGRRLVREAETCKERTRAGAEMVRDGLLLMLATSLPQRATPIAALDNGTTLQLLQRPLVQINIPGSLLKGRQAVRRHRTAYIVTLENPEVWDALVNYFRNWRPLLDDGTYLWPSMRCRGRALRSDRLSMIMGNLTERHLGTRVSLHRVRDAVATEAIEHMPQGAVLAPVLLGHRDARTTARHYDHAQGIAASRAWSDRIAHPRRRRFALP